MMAAVVWMPGDACLIPHPTYPTHITHRTHPTHPNQTHPTHPTDDGCWVMANGRRMNDD
jgi:hypothetical protein